MGWFNWGLLEKNGAMFRFFQQMIAFRKRMPILRRNTFFNGQVNQRRLADVSWHGCRLYSPGWNDPSSRALAFTLGNLEEGSREDQDLHVMLNMEWEDLDFDVPALAERTWYRVIDTARVSPDDFVEPGDGNVVLGTVYRVKSHSIVVLVNR